MVLRNLSVAKYRVDHPPRGITRCRELIAVAIAQIDRDPVVRDRLVEPALKIAVAYVEKIITLKYATHRYPVAHENAKDLEDDFIIGRSVKHGHPRSRDAFSNSNPTTRLPYGGTPAISKVIPVSVSDPTDDCAIPKLQC